MQLIQEHLKLLTEVFSKKINFLVVEDNTIMGNSIIELFSSPLFNSCLAASASKARDIIAKNGKWHCWILDIKLEEEQGGLRLLAEHPMFPFVVMLSGMRSMNIASRAMQLGAYKVFDKDPNLLPTLHSDVCTLAALAYILNSTGTKYFSLFLLLAQMEIATTEIWAKQSCLTVRQLERICSLHTHLTPRFIPSLFYTLKFLLQFDPSLPVQSTHPSFDNDVALQQHIEFIVKHIDTIIKN